MKRSEIVEIIDRHLESYVSLAHNGLIDLDAASDLLSALEKVGMSPPPAPVGYIDGLDMMTKFENKWEDE